MPNPDVYPNMPDEEVLRYWRDDNSVDLTANHGSGAYHSTDPEADGLA